MRLRGFVRLHVYLFIVKMLDDESLVIELILREKQYKHAVPSFVGKGSTSAYQRTELSRH